MSPTFHPSPFLRYALMADAAVSGFTGLLMAVGAGSLSTMFGLPFALLLGAGLMLLPFAAFAAWIGRREVIAACFVWAVIALNLVWAADSILLLISGWVTPTGLGYGFVVFQALVVLAFAEAQFIGLRRMDRAIPARA